ncbi:TetR/AcrR family transcriptional regulator [Allokutzneria albata]|uniref:TetR/AcrR family transcriptional regulator n=1 Tax=Allokutzneria albata TaxID=211114 RepID=UPI000A7D6988|nr:TetR/AcrR family transcriptional regulator [Allokutzneria albata]
MSRRERLRAELDQDLRATARRLLVASGPEAVAFTAIARELSITPPAIYRYYANRDELIQALAHDLVTELVQGLHAAAATVGDQRPGQQILVMMRDFRAWSLRNRAEFALLLGTPMPEGRVVSGSIMQDWMWLAKAFGVPFERLWQQRPFEVPADAELSRELAAQLDLYREQIGFTALPKGAVLVFFECWSRIYGATCLDVYGHFSMAVPDVVSVYERMCQGVCDMLGIDYEPPANTAGGP